MKLPLHDTKDKSNDNHAIYVVHKNSLDLMGLVLLQPDSKTLFGVFLKQMKEAHTCKSSAGLGSSTLLTD